MILEEVVPPEEIACLTQKMISFKVDTKLKLSLVNSLTDLRDKARTASLGLLTQGIVLLLFLHPSLAYT